MRRTEGAQRLKYVRERRQSVLDHLRQDAERLSARLPESYRPVLGSYLQTVRELELQLGTTSSCEGSGLAPPRSGFSAGLARTMRSTECITAKDERDRSASLR